MKTQEPRHGDPLDSSDIPGNSDLDIAYYERMMPPHMQGAVAKLKAERETEQAKPKAA